MSQAFELADLKKARIGDGVVTQFQPFQTRTLLQGAQPGRGHLCLMQSQRPEVLEARAAPSKSHR